MKQCDHETGSTGSADISDDWSDIENDKVPEEEDKENDNENKYSDDVEEDDEAGYSASGDEESSPVWEVYQQRLWTM